MIFMKEPQKSEPLLNFAEDRLYHPSRPDVQKKVRISLDGQGNIGDGNEGDFCINDNKELFQANAVLDAKRNCFRSCSSLLALM